MNYDSPGGTSGKMRGYLVQPAGEGPFPSVLVIHENRGLNPHIEDVARRAAVAGFDEVNTDGDEDSRAQTLAPKIVAVLEQAHEAVGDDVPGRRCSEAIAVGVVAGMGQDTAEAGE